MAFPLTIEQVSFPSDSYSTICSSVDSLNSVVDANTDFTMMTDSSSENVIFDNKETGTISELPQNSVKTRTNDNHLAAVDSDVTCVAENNGNQTEQDPPRISLDEGNMTFSYDSLASSYPEIPFPVAQMVNKNNPEWYAAEMYSRLTSVSALPGGDVNPLKKVTPSSPFQSMAASSEALALQHSVIGSRDVKPVSPDVVAEIVAKTRHRLSGSNLYSNFDGNPIIYTKPNMPVGSENSLMSSKTLHSRTSSCSSVSSSRSSKRTSKERDIPLVHTSKHRLVNPSNHFASTPLVKDKTIYAKHTDYVPDSETESCVSERLELESLCSENFETESSMSDVSGLDEEVFRIRKFMSEGKHVCNGPLGSDSSPMLPNSKMSVSMLNLPNFEILKKDQSTETEHIENFELLRAKANLEGRLESITKNEMDLSKECTALKSLVISLQADVEALTKKCELGASEKLKLVKELDFEKKQQEKWDNVLKEYQNAMECKNSELKALKEDLLEVEQMNTQARMKFEELKVDTELKDGSITGLKKKIAELHVEVQVLLQGKVQLENEVKGVRHEIATLQKSKAWYQDQLRSTQESRNKLHQDLITLQSDHVSLSNSMEKAKTEITHLKQQLGETQHRAVTEKEMLMKHLETIEADMMEREAMFEEIQKDKGSVENAFLERAKRMEEERSKLTNLMFSVSDLDYQLNAAKSEGQEKDKNISDLEKEKAELTKQLTFLQKSVTSKGLNVQQLEQSLKDANSKIRHLENSLTAAENLITNLKDEKTASDVALASANEEKRIINESLKVLKENLNHVENNFKKMRADLVAKSSKTEQLAKEKIALEDALARAEEKILQQRKSFEQQMFCGAQDRDKVVGHLRKEKNDIENVLDVYSKDLYSYQQTIQQLSKEKENLISEISEFRNAENTLRDKLGSLMKENHALQSKVSSLSETLGPNALQTVGDDLGKTDMIYSMFENNGNIFEKPEKDRLRKYRSNIRFLLKKLKEKMKECDKLKNEVQVLNENETIQSIKENVENIKVGSTNEENCLELEEEIQQLRKQLEEERTRQESNQKLIMELEKEKGKISAISDSNNTLKLRISELETALSEKGTFVSNLSCKLKMAEEHLEEINQQSHGKLCRLEEDLNKEKTIVKNLRRQVFEEKRSTSNLNRQLNSLKSALDQANQIADARKAEITSLQLEVDQKIQNELKQRAEVEQLRTEIHFYRAEIDTLKKELQEMLARDPALAEQIKSLSWHLKEKNNEIAALKEKETCLEDRYKSQISDLKKATQILQDELGTYKSELDNIRKEKFRYQSQFAQLRKVLGSKIRNSKSPKIIPSSESSAALSDKVLSNLDSDEVSGFDESYVNSLLQRSFQPSESRPLSHLQACLSSLKKEMAILQEHLCDNEEDV